MNYFFVERRYFEGLYFHLGVGVSFVLVLKLKSVSKISFLPERMSLIQVEKHVPLSTNSYRTVWITFYLVTIKILARIKETESEN